MGRVALFHGPGRSFEIAERPEPAPTGGEFLIRVAACGISPGDLSIYSGAQTVATPAVLGQYIVGRIVDFGPDAARHDGRGVPLTTGDLVTWSATTSCGVCRPCKRRLPQLCERASVSARATNQNSKLCAGGCADYVLVEAGRALVKLKPDLNESVAVLVAGPAASAAAAVRAAGILIQRAVLVVGDNLASTIAAPMASTIGADVISSVTPEACPADQFDVVLVFASEPASISAALRSARSGGHVIIAGVDPPPNAMPVNVEALVSKMQRISGIFNYAPIDLYEAVAFLEVHARSWPFPEALGPTFAFESIDEAFAYAQRLDRQVIAVQP